MTQETQTKYFRFFTRSLWLGLLVLSINTANASNMLTTTAEAEHQQLYRQTLLAIKKGHRTRTQEGLEQLAEHPLYPYLEKAQLEKKLRSLPTAEVTDFLSRHGDSVAGKQLRKRWLLTLAQKKQWQALLADYDANVANNELRCWRLEALYQSGLEQAALAQTESLWLSGDSLPDACNPSFKRWQQAGFETDALVWQRINLAVNARNLLLARYLSNHASAELKPYSRRLLSVHRDPRRLKVFDDFSDQSLYTADIVSHGLKRLATRDYQLATKLWIDYRGMIQFSSHQHSDIRDKIARQIIASGSDDALPWLIVHDPNAEDNYLTEWRIRLALRQQQWSQAEHWIALLPTEYKIKPSWRYWLARSWQLQNKHLTEARGMLIQLAAERNYYGFLAAESINQKYGFNNNSLVTNFDRAIVAGKADIIRAQQFYQMGELIPARREWYAAISGLNQSQLLAATQIAHQWGWHQQAINTTIKAGHWDDLAIRFPLAYRSNMLDSAKLTTIRPEWLYAIARQESAFASDAYSSVGARGLLQLRPSTAKNVARKIGIPFKKQDLFIAENNITLGSNYLKELLEVFSGNHILATAAYNAGPHRVKKWLNNQSSALPYDIWIETLPFHETRNYVQNVLAFSIIYGHRLGITTSLTGDTPLLIGRDQ
ncbi:transglycosylase SLT domain-containing protein [Oceanicoccus sp. KOV_DT_Chl]|uniref:transglycosylase SLT domain-containing protein n=1 Tax=Oceanicoccus sp. KOV_DT_Chl TaxID=1904639 RepID=UPI000C79BD09|nr:transglycosylase SLT domain-containing protein [Oceanicoccus sp. KOV_DT_Chl]